jgi:hypothetical protein
MFKVFRRMLKNCEKPKVETECKVNYYLLLSKALTRRDGEK